MMVAHERRLTYVNLVLALFFLLVKPSPAKAQDNCVPDSGESGSLESVVVIIQTWEARSSNFHVSI